MTKLCEKCMNLEQELRNTSNVTPETLTMLWKLEQTLSSVLKQEKKTLIKEHKVGYSNVFPELGLQLQIIHGDNKSVYDQNKIRSYIGQKSWNQLSSVTKAGVVELFGPAEATKIFALALKYVDEGEPKVDIRPITKKTLNVE